MERKIPILVSEDVYYRLQTMCTPACREIGDVIVGLLQCQDNCTVLDASEYGQRLRRQRMLGETNG